MYVALLTIVINVGHQFHTLTIDSTVLESAAKDQCPLSKVRKGACNNITQMWGGIYQEDKNGDVWLATWTVLHTGLILIYSKRACQPSSNSGGCSSTTFNIGVSAYSRVHGRVIGHQVGSTSAFAWWWCIQYTSNGCYVESVNSHGSVACSMVRNYACKSGIFRSVLYCDHIP